MDTTPSTSAPPQSAVISAISLVMNDIKSQWNVRVTRYNEMEGKCGEVFCNIRALEMSLELIQKEIAAQLAFHRRRRNSLVAPPSRLPNEVLSHIFLCLVKLELPRELCMLSRLSLVCTWWNQVIEATPGLWSYITSNRAWSKTSMQIIKSKNAALSISVARVRSPDAQFFGLIGEHISRWRSVEIESADSWSDQYAPGPAPMLEKFVLSSKHVPTQQVDLFRGQAPRLRHLEIPSLPIAWTSSILSGLFVLDILAFDGQSIPSAEEFCRVLIASPQLKELRISGQSDDICVPSDRREFLGNISMPVLDRIVLLDLHPVTVRSILSSIRTSRRCNIRVHFPEGFGIEYEECILQIYSDLQKQSLLSEILQRPQEVDLLDSEDAGVRNMIIRTQDPDSKVEMFRSGLPSDISSFSIYNVAISIANRSLISSITLGDIEDAMDRSSISLRQVLADLHGLRKLSLSGFHHQRPFHELSAPFSGNGSASTNLDTWLCPLLETLTLSDTSFTMDELEDFIDLRLVISQLPSGSPNPLAMLKSLSIEDAHDCSGYDVPIELGLKIVEILGKEEFVWDGQKFDLNGKFSDSAAWGWSTGRRNYEIWDSVDEDSDGPWDMYDDNDGYDTDMYLD